MREVELLTRSYLNGLSAAILRCRPQRCAGSVRCSGSCARQWLAESSFAGFARRPAPRQTTLCNYPAAERGDFGVVRPRRFPGPECRARGAAQAARGRLRLEIDLNTDRAWVARALRPRVPPWDAGSPKWISRLSSRERALVVSGCLTPVIFALDHFVPNWIFEWLRTEGMDIPEPRREILLTLRTRHKINARFGG
jgi:hypothetical protein